VFFCIVSLRFHAKLFGNVVDVTLVFFIGRATTTRGIFFLFIAVIGISNISNGTNLDYRWNAAISVIVDLLFAMILSKDGYIWTWFCSRISRRIAFLSSY